MISRRLAVGEIEGAQVWELFALGGTDRLIYVAHAAESTFLLFWSFAFAHISSSEAFARLLERHTTLIVELAQV